MRGPKGSSQFLRKPTTHCLLVPHCLGEAGRWPQRGFWSSIICIHSPEVSLNPTHHAELPKRPQEVSFNHVRQRVMIVQPTILPAWPVMPLSHMHSQQPSPSQKENHLPGHCPSAMGSHLSVSALVWTSHLCHLWGKLMSTAWERNGTTAYSKSTHLFYFISEMYALCMAVHKRFYRAS
jgi:hypothetical protein